ncbi:MAG: amidohydrolase [Bacteroidetes bacterium]|nr:amidohydrolase [Bacteroidota bacterium]
MKVDIHTHIIPENLPDLRKKYGYGGFISLDHHKAGCARMMMDGKFFREIEHNCWDPKIRISECDEQDIQLQVLSTIPVMFSYWTKAEDGWDLSKYLNDHIAEIVRDFPHRFLGLGTVPLQDTNLAIKEMERCMNELGLSGVQIGSHVESLNLNDEKLFPFFEAAEKLGASIFVHPWDVMGREAMDEYWLPWLVGMPAETSRAICSMIFGGIFEKLPNLRVAFAHGGGSFPSTIGRIEHGFNVRPDLVAVDNAINPKEYLGKFYLDSLVHDQEMLKYIVNLIGREKVSLGTDYPFPLGELQPGKLIEDSDFDLETKEWLNYRSALDWLGMESKAFEELIEQKAASS